MSAFTHNGDRESDGGGGIPSPNKEQNYAEAFVLILMSFALASYSQERDQGGAAPRDVRYTRGTVWVRSASETRGLLCAINLLHLPGTE